MEENQINTQQQPKNNLFSYLLAAFFAVFIGSGIFLIISNKKPSVVETNNIVNTAQENVVVPPVATNGVTLTLQTDLPDAKATVATQMSLDLVADSNSKNIVGYDVVLAYDPLSFDFVKADSIDPSYKIYTYKKGNYLTLTATKSLQSPAAPFSNNKIVTLYFSPIKSGQYDFSLKSVFTTKEKTDFITDKTEVLTPSLNDLKIDVIK